MKVKYTEIGTCLMCQKKPCQCETKEVCCVCGEFAEYHCGSCKTPFCETHYKTTVMTGNCCSGNEKDYN